MDDADGNFWAKQTVTLTVAPSLTGLCVSGMMGPIQASLKTSNQVLNVTSRILAGF